MEKIMIMVPCAESIWPDTMKCIWDLNNRPHPGYELDFDYIRGHSVARARNLCVHRAMTAKADRMLFIDGDHTFAPMFLDMLFEDDLDVVMGYYDHRSQDPEDTLLRTNLCKLGQISYMEQITPDEMAEARDEGYDLVEVKGGGLGFTLVKMDVFAKLSYPYFKYIEYPDGHCLSEDLYFSENLAHAGIPIYADTRCYCGHIMRKVQGGDLGWYGKM